MTRRYPPRTVTYVEKAMVRILIMRGPGLDSRQSVSWLAQPMQYIYIARVLGSSQASPLVGFIQNNRSNYFN